MSFITKRYFSSNKDYQNYFSIHEHCDNKIEVVELKATVFACCILNFYDWRVAVRRFCNALSDDERFDGSYRFICRCINHGIWNYKSDCGFFFSVNSLSDGSFLISLQVPDYKKLIIF